MNERLALPGADIIAQQKLAADPNASAWVAANAGSGKTHVLTERVLRLLLANVAPENLLCLTYTKAAAAEMRRRVSGALAKWTIASEGELIEALTELTGARPNARQIHRARTLFGYALETPGGLKINTIHAFCESVLHRFPLEAGVPLSFSVIDDSEQADLLRIAREQVLSQGLRGEGNAAGAVAYLFATLSDDQIEKAVRTAIGKGQKLQAVLADPDAAKRNLRALLEYNGEAVTDLRAGIARDTLLTAELVATIVALLDGDPGKSSRFVDRLARLDMKAIDGETLRAAFLTADNQLRKSLLPKKERETYPDLQHACEREGDRLAALFLRIKTAELVARSEALIDISAAISAIYLAQKHRRSKLDFNDLIAHMGQLLGSGASQDWVRYKLDASLTHILVDESQDTNPEQWAVVRILSEEFFDGESAVLQPRTLFAVGDKKQSIYSFQGAEPQLFSDLGRELARKAGRAGKGWNGVRLRASFRTLQGVLDGVDLVFAQPEIAAAMLPDGEADLHESARVDKGGTITLWPPVGQEDAEMPEGRWPVDGDFTNVKNPARIVAERIAGQIKDWTDNGQPLAQRKRAIRAEDVLILVQSRGPLFHEIVRALKRAKLPSPGSDRVAVSSHIAVLDLLALGDILLNPADDLNLAALLRSPLFEVDETALYELAHGRAKRTSLWQALKSAPDGPAQDAYLCLSRWRGRLDFDRPYDFFAQVLYAEGGLKKFHARLGAEVDDVIAEFLDLALEHENNAQPSLQGFLAAMRKSDIEIKRDLELSGGVRVMTVHGAKGLEAPIVFLADAATPPNVKTDPVYIVPETPGPLLIHASAKGDHVPETSAFRDADSDNQKAEYWRKLYVGMTRAEDVLYVTGILNKRTKVENTWYGAIEAALMEDSTPCSIPASEDKGIRFPEQTPEPLPVEKVVAPSVPAEDDFVIQPLPKQVEVEFVRPSQAHEDGEVGELDVDVFQTSAAAVLDAEQARKQGIALHALLQHLGALDPDIRYEIGLRSLESLLPDFPKKHQGLVEKALAILGNPENKFMFGPESRPEVPFLIDALRGKKPVRIAGRMDRLIVTEHEILAVDFKSDSNPPDDVANVPASYLTQLGLYALVGKKLFPQRQTGAAIFWTSNEKLMRLPQNALDDAIAAFTLAP